MACPVAGGPQWIEATSTHFTLRTDVPAGDAENMLRAAEETLAQFTQVADFFLPSTTTMGRTSLVVFDKLWEYQKLVTPELIGHGFVELGRFVPHDERGRATIALTTEKQADEVFRHELAHRVLHQRVGDVPQWLDEGFADYFTVLPVGDGKIALGGPTSRLRQFNNSANRGEMDGPKQQFYAEPTLLMKDMLEDDKKYGYDNVGYFVAWVLVHYLANGAPDHAEKFRRLMSALVDGQPWPKALTAEYGSLQSIEDASRKHLLQMAGNEALQWFIPYTPAPSRSWRVAVRALDDGEVHHLKAALLPSAEMDELKLATLHAPKSAELHRWVGEPGRGAARRRRGRARDRDGDGAVDRIRSIAWSGRASISSASCASPRRSVTSRRLQDEMRATARHASEPEQLSTFAHYYELTHDYAFGTTLAARAVAMDPRCASCLVTLASLYFASGKNDDAATTLASAVNRWPDKTVPPEMVARLKQYRCASAREKGAACAP